MEGFDMFEPLESPIADTENIWTHALPHFSNDYNVFTCNNRFLMLVHTKTGASYFADIRRSFGVWYTEKCQLLGVKQSSLTVDEQNEQLVLKTAELNVLFQKTETKEYFEERIELLSFEMETVESIQHRIDMYTRNLHEEHELMDKMLQFMSVVSTVSDSQFVLK